MYFVYDFIIIIIIIIIIIAFVIPILFSVRHNPLGNLNSGRKPGERSSLQA